VLNVNNIIQTGGLLLIALIIFGESGMFIGFFFPGDTLLLAAGVFAAQGKLSIEAVIAVIAAAAILGDNIGYLIGRKYGRKLFDRPDSLIFRQEYLHRAEAFFRRYGARTMLFAHFVPIVRTFAPAAAGMSNMDHKRFVIYDAIGDIFWATSITMVGYLFGTRIPDIDKYLHYAVAGVVIITLVPTLYHLGMAIREKNRNKQASEKTKD
jgi:membrane-associated protein